jgi:hypothetical protein
VQLEVGIRQSREIRASRTQKGNRPCRPFLITVMRSSRDRWRPAERNTRRAKSPATLTGHPLHRMLEDVLNGRTVESRARRRKIGEIIKTFRYACVLNVAYRPTLPNRKSTRPAQAARSYRHNFMRHASFPVRPLRIDPQGSAVQK